MTVATQVPPAMNLVTQVKSDSTCVARDVVVAHTDECQGTSRVLDAWMSERETRENWPVRSR